MSVQPHPEPLWPAWSSAPGAAVGRQEPAPTPLRDTPEVGPQGLRAVDPVELARADPRMRPYLTGDSVEAPGRAGLRPAVQRDLTGDGQPDLIVAADTATGRSALSVYSVADGRIVSVLFTIGRQLVADAIGLRWKIAALLAVGCSLVAVTIGFLIHGARAGQIGDAARASATAQLISVRKVYELTGRLDRGKVGEADARIDCAQLPGPLRAAALAGQRSTYLDMSGRDPAV